MGGGRGTFTFNGIGTTLYGKREQESDGSYVTTEWVVLLWVPVYPLRSLRILPSGEETTAIVYNSFGYHCVEVPLNAHQVRNGYAVTLAIVAIVTAAGLW